MNAQSMMAGGPTANIGYQAQKIDSTNAETALNHAERREDTAIQRQVADMKAAGLNPILAATHGYSGASSAASAKSIANEAEKTNALTKLLSTAIMLMMAGL